MYVHTYLTHTHTHARARTHAHARINQYNLATSFTYTPKTTKQCAMSNAVLQIQKT